MDIYLPIWQMHCALKDVGTTLAAMQAACKFAMRAGVTKAYCVRWTVWDTACCCAGWRYESMLCEADNVDTGVMWECPLLLELQQAPSLPWQHSVRGVGSLRTIMDSHTALGNGSSPSEGWPTTLDSIKEARNQVGKTPRCAHMCFWQRSSSFEVDKLRVASSRSSSSGVDKM